MHITSWYTDNFEDRLQGRYITLKHLEPILDSYREVFNVSVAGTSEMGLDIPLVICGRGPKKVLIWSQMHGNESTTTKALFDFFKFMNSNEGQSAVLLASHTFYVLPMLNPDGAALYIRENVNKVDLNRDAQQLSQRESIVLKSLFDSIQPDICLNMHDQRSIFGLADGFPATVSFLAPAAEILKSITPARQEAMALIVKMTRYLKDHCPNQIGRFDDTFNQNCMGDAFSSLGVPTILFEAGHYTNDYNREQTRSFVFYALIALCAPEDGKHNVSLDYKEYYMLPENKKNFHDLVLYNVRTPGDAILKTVCFQYKEVLIGATILFDLYVARIEVDTAVYGHQTFDLQGGRILLNSHENIIINKKILTIFDINKNLILI
ncbi:MAG: hypothetical protein ACI9RL_000981 [Candidatus Paceibacteria bacterium]|jgi:hypothetical protein